MKRLIYLTIMVFLISCSSTKAVETSSKEDKYIASGTEPFWSVKIEKGMMIYERMGEEPISFKISESKYPEDTKIQQHFIGEGISVTLTKESCSDGMSDNTYEYSSWVQIKNEQLRGCARKID